MLTLQTLKTRIAKHLPNIEDTTQTNQEDIEFEATGNAFYCHCAGADFPLCELFASTRLDTLGFRGWQVASSDYCYRFAFSCAKKRSSVNLTRGFGKSLEMG
jgi:hypothetical protein